MLETSEEPGEIARAKARVPGVAQGAVERVRVQGLFRAFQAHTEAAEVDPVDEEQAHTPHAHDRVPFAEKSLTTSPSLSWHSPTVFTGSSTAKGCQRLWCCRASAVSAP